MENSTTNDVDHGTMEPPRTTTVRSQLISGDAHPSTSVYWHTSVVTDRITMVTSNLFIGFIGETREVRMEVLARKPLETSGR